MDKSILEENLIKNGFQKQLIEEILTIGKYKKINAGDAVIKSGSKPDFIPLVISGVLKVSRYDHNDGELFLYYLEGGETCAMSISCCIDQDVSQFNVVAEEDTELWLIPTSVIDDWIVKYLSFRQFIFQSYKSRFDELLKAIDSVAFMKMDERLFKYLLDKKQSSGSYSINKTHEQIARELNTSRVVISRLLKKLEKENKIEQYRNKIDIL